MKRMNEWENNEKDRVDEESAPENIPSEPASETPEAEAETSSGESETGSASAGRGPDTEEFRPYREPAFVWEGTTGKKGGKRRGGGRAKTFCAVAIVCLLLTAAICVPTILYMLDGGSSVGGTSGPAASLGPNENGQYEISQTLQVNTEPAGETSDLEALYERCSVSCVTIYVTFGSASSGYAIGSGFVLTEDGYIATNQHVVDGGEEFIVIFYDGSEYKASLVGGDSTRDLAVLKIDAEELTPLAIGNSDALKVGQTVVAIGTPYDLELAGTLTRGIISGLNRDIDIYDENTGRVVKTMRMIQTDTSINPGNSGGPMINLSGQVVGINSMKLINEYEGLGFAIPINYAVDIFNQLIQYGRVVKEPENSYVNIRASLGIKVMNAELGLSEYHITPRGDYPTEGAIVISVEPNTAVYAAGLAQFDIITEFDGHAITSSNDLVEILKQYRAGDSVTMTVFTFYRNFSGGETRTLSFVLDSAA